MNFEITDKILKIINYTLFFIYVFVFTLSTAICKVWGNINLMHIKTLTCDNCLDLYGLKVGLQLLSVCIFLLFQQRLSRTPISLFLFIFLYIIRRQSTSCAAGTQHLRLSDEWEPDGIVGQMRC